MSIELDKRVSLKSEVRVRRYALSVALVALATLLGAPIHTIISPTNLVMLYLAVVVIAALYLGRGPSILAAVLGVLAFDFFFVPPTLTFAIAHVEYAVAFAGLFIVSLVISTLTARVREEADAARRRELQTIELNEFSRDLAAAIGLEDILRAVSVHVGRNFGRPVIVLLPERESLELSLSSRNSAVDPSELALAGWVYKHGQAAGLGTSVYPTATAHYLPLKTANGVIGVLGVRPTDPGPLLMAEQQRLLESFAAQAALAIERADLAEQARRAQMLEATDKLQAALLNSISHDLRTPLVSITGSLSSLQEDRLRLDDAVRRSLIENAYEEAMRLNHLVSNLLDMTRIEAKALKVAPELCDVQDVIGSTLQRTAGRLKGRKVNVDVPPNLPLVPMDFVLMVQVLVNLLENAAKYSPADQAIDIWAREADGCVQVQVADRGIGIPPEDLPRVFDKFYRVQRPDGVHGTGLGLAICKGIVEAHGGKIDASNRSGGGTIITVALSLKQTQAAVQETAA